MHYKKIFLILCIIFALLSFSGCQSSSSEEPSYEVVTLEDGTELFRYSGTMEYYAIRDLKNYTSDVYVTPHREINGYPIKGIWEKANVGNTSIKTMIVTDNIEIIEFDVFYYEFSSLESIFIGAGTKKVQYGMFARCPNLMQVTVDIRNPTYYSENNAIIERDTCRIVAASNATRDIPTTAKILAGDSFSGLNLEEIMLPDNIEKIEAHAFQNCTKLLAVYIPRSIHTIDTAVFARCENVTIFCEGEKKPDGWADNWCQYGPKEVRWGVTREEYEAYLDSLDLTSETKD